MAGRKRIPDEIKRLKGTAQKCRLAKTDAQVEAVGAMVTPPKVPMWLDKQARKIFATKASQLSLIGVLTPLDLELLSAYAAAMSLVVQASAEIQAGGMLVTSNTKTGTITIANPVIKIMKDNIKVINQIGAQFGFSPSSRASIMAMATKKEKKKDDFDEFEEIE